MVITRFAPSPTGNLHIGGARTALFNFLYSRSQKGKFLLRIEDTDKERSKKEYEDQIIKSLNWLGINFDENVVYQSSNIDKHKKIAKELFEKKFAYKCYCTNEELEQKKQQFIESGINYQYDGKCRNLNEEKNLSYVLRLKVQKNTKIILHDGVQGNVEIDSNTIEDFVLLRSDGSPTYNLSASVDDKLMNITHVIRGDDHKINAIKQILIFKFLDWKLPKYFHVPLIHSENGKKLSKRDNASTTDDYKKIGILPEALRNYLLRLGWSYKDKEIFNDEESIKFFSLKNIGKSPSRLDIERIKSLNEHYIKNINDTNLSQKLKIYIDQFKEPLKKNHENLILQNINIFKNKANTLEDIYDNASFIFKYDEKVIDGSKIINDKNKIYLKEFIKELSKLNEYEENIITKIIEDILKKNKINFKDLGQPLRIVLTGSSKAPSIKDILKILGIEEAINRIKRHI